MRRHFSITTFVAVAAVMTVALNALAPRADGREVRPLVSLTAQAAEVPVARPLPIDSVDGLALASAPVDAAADLAIAPPPEQFVGAAAARVAPPAPLHAAASSGPGREPGTWAVVIGINDYPGSTNDLEYAGNDASDVVQALSQQGVPADHVMSLRDGQVTADVVRASVRWLTSHAGPEAVAVFFYAGHVRKRGGSEAIVTADGATVTDKELAGLLRPLAARRAWITIAACYGGGFTEVLAPGRVLTAAAPENSVAYESSAFRRSYLAEFMVRRAMIQGAADATVQSAFAWAHNTISHEYPGREPVQYDSSDGQLDLRPHAGTANNSSPGTGAPAPESSPPAQAPPPDSAPPPEGSQDPPPQKCSGLLRLC